MDRFAEVVECSRHFRFRVTKELQENPPSAKEVTERFQIHIRETELLAAHSHNFVGHSEEALLACDRTGIHSGDGDYTSVKDKEFAVSVLAARVIALSRLHRFPTAKRYIVEIYKVAEGNVDESWTTRWL